MCMGYTDQMLVLKSQAQTQPKSMQVSKCSSKMQLPNSSTIWAEIILQYPNPNPTPTPTRVSTRSEPNKHNPDFTFAGSVWPCQCVFTQQTRPYMQK